MCSGFDLGCWGSSFLEAISRIFMTIFEAIIGGFVALIDLLPLPISAADINAAVDALPPSVFWGFELFQIAQGVTIVMGSYVVRFIIRRLPVVG